jgi:hypothetical protein
MLTPFVGMPWAGRWQPRRPDSISATNGARLVSDDDAITFLGTARTRSSIDSVGSTRKASQRLGTQRSSVGFNRHLRGGQARDRCSAHLAVGLAMEALRAGYLVRYTTLDVVVRELRPADQLGTLHSKLAHYQRLHLLVCDEVGYMRLEHGDANRFFRHANRRYTRSSMIVTRQQARVRMGRAARRRSPSRREPRPPPARRRDPHHQRPILATTRPRRPPQTARRKRRDEPVRNPSSTAAGRREAHATPTERFDASNRPQQPRETAFEVSAEHRNKCLRFHQMGTAQIRVERQARGWADLLRRYTVVLDGTEVGRIKRGESITLEADPGHHELHLRIDWARSPSLELNLAEDQQLTIRCWSKANPLAWPYWITLGRSRYIGIEAPHEDAAPVGGR